MAGLDYLGDSALIKERATATMRARVAEELGATVELDVDVIVPNPYQPRVDFAAVDDMVESLRVHGQLYPVLVRARGPGYEVADGETRLRAARILRDQDPEAKGTITAIVRAFSDEDMAVVAFASVYGRQDLSPIEEAQGLKRLATDFGLTESALASRLGKTSGYVHERLRLLKLPEDLQEALGERRLLPGHAIALAAFEDPGERKRLLADVVDESLSVRDLRALRPRTPLPPEPVTSPPKDLRVPEVPTPLSTRYQASDAPEDESRDREWSELRSLWKTLPTSHRTQVLVIARSLAASGARGTKERAPTRAGSRKGFMDHTASRD